MAQAATGGDAGAQAVSPRQLEWESLRAQLARQWQAYGRLLEPEADGTARAAAYLERALAQQRTLQDIPDLEARVIAARAALAAGEGRCRMESQRLRAAGRGARGDRSDEGSAVSRDSSAEGAREWGLD